MKHTLYLEAQREPAVLERLLRVTRHRQFEVDALTMAPASNGENLNLVFTVTSERPIHLLQSQLEKLNDVVSVELEQKQAVRASA